MKRILICCNNDFFKKKIKKKKFFFINSNKKFTLKYLEKIKPDIIFFPHWNYKINKKIYTKYTCIGFHSSPLPFGRGGSPIQNMIIKGHKKTEICAYKINSFIDAGPVYIRKKISLLGSGDEIFLRIYRIINKLIFKLIVKLPSPKKQIGKVKYFKRRKPEDGNLLVAKNLNQIFNLIRMLDVNFLNYPKAFIENEKIIFNFKNAKLRKNKIEAKVEILRK